ncbi:hypothetical protein P8452_51367 [Trifolium repens]|nr:hypothetical protein P8452_51367 [Trifolium repens]
MGSPSSTAKGTTFLGLEEEDAIVVLRVLDVLEDLDDVDRHCILHVSDLNSKDQKMNQEINSTTQGVMNPASQGVNGQGDHGLLS